MRVSVPVLPCITRGFPARFDYRRLKVNKFERIFPNAVKFTYTQINTSCYSRNPRRSWQHQLPKHDKCPRNLCWGGGVQNSPRSCNSIYCLRSLHNAVLPSTPQSLHLTRAFDEGYLYRGVFSVQVFLSSACSQRRTSGRRIGQKSDPWASHIETEQGNWSDIAVPT
jgi:hypothetical protein